MSAFALPVSAFQFKTSVVELQWAPFSHKHPVAGHFLGGCATPAPCVPE